MKHTRFPALLALLCACFLGGCAWGYAGEDGKVVTEPQVHQDTKVVKFDESPQADDQPAVQSSKEAKPADPGSPCGVDTFTIERYTAEKHETKTIKCADHTVVHVERTPMGDTQLQEARAAGYPEGDWFVLVDPKGLRAKYLSNDELIKISKQFDVKYLDKDRTHDLLIYQYNDRVQ